MRMQTESTSIMPPPSDAIADLILEGPEQPQVVYRLSGDAYLLVEYGEMILDLNLRCRVHLLEQALKGMRIKGLMETIPGVLSLLIKYNGCELPLAKLIETLKFLEKDLPSPEAVEIPSRMITLPIACHDRWTREGMDKYSATVRAEAPYLPDNVEFVARCNGLEKVEQVDAYLAATEHLVIGLGDVYLGAPCAVPMDPRYRLVAPKYNPARMYTPEGAVGIGGAYICIYPMESPGGYQLVGRTLPIWNTYQTSAYFAEAPWLLRFFDRIKFEPVSERELEKSRDSMSKGEYPLQVKEGSFSLKKYNIFCDSVQKKADALKIRQREAAARSTQGY